MKSKRQSKILEIIQNNDINTQDGLLEHLRLAGFDVTQATISRDIREMKLVKVNKGGCYKYAAPEASQLTNNLQDIIFNSVIGVDFAVNTVVLKCHTGMAQAACAAFDSIGFDEIVGTIAGDDTIFVLTRSQTVAENLCRDLQEGIFVKKNLNA